MPYVSKSWQHPKADDDQGRRGARRCRRSRCRRNDGEQIRSDIDNVHEVVREVVVEIEVRVLYADENVIVLEIVEVREDVIEIVKVLMTQLHQETFKMMHKSEFAASGRIGSMKAV